MTQTPYGDYYRPEDDRMDEWDMVREFHEAYGLPVAVDDAAVDGMDLRRELIEEERRELLKELVDLAYVTVGEDVEWGEKYPRSITVLKLFAEAMGFDFDGAFREVHRSNMSKLGSDGKPVKREDGKVLKGPNYTPADMTDFV